METKPTNETLESFKRAFKVNLLRDTMHKNSTPNLTKEQRTGLYEFEKISYCNQKADNGSATVIMNTTDYNSYRQLSDSNFYTKLKDDPTLKISDTICRTVT